MIRKDEKVILQELLTELELLYQTLDLAQQRIDAAQQQIKLLLSRGTE